MRLTATSGLHALIQTRPHAGATTPSTQQLTCFRWMLAHGADPEALGAWPKPHAPTRSWGQDAAGRTPRAIAKVKQQFALLKSRT